MQRKLLVIINVDFDARGQLLIIYYAFVKYLRKNGNTTKKCFSYLWTLRKPVCDSVSKEFFCSILTEFGIP